MRGGDGWPHPSFVNYAQATDHLLRLQMFGARPGLDTPRRLAERAGHPERLLRFVHVAGTNGKGSTCAMLEAVYRAADLRVGLYTSPHLVSFRERIQVNRRLIPEEAVARLMAEFIPWLAEFSAESHPTFFEVATLMALRWFAEERCDLVIWETGLGGRLDATNIVTPLVSVITNIQLDHEKWLGDTIETIAGEKAGIIKPRVPVVTAADDPRALAVLASVASEQGAPISIVGADEAAPVPATLALAGAHQRLNAALVLRVVGLLQGEFPVSPEAVGRGFEQVEWPGRFQVLQRDGRTLVLDGAHNPAGARALAAALGAKFPHQPLTLVLGVLDDKDWTAVCRALAPLASRVLLAPVASPRSAGPEQLATVCREANPRAEVLVTGSCAAALQLSAQEPLVVLTGSLYFIGEAMELLGLGAAVGERGLNEWTQPGAQKPAC